MSRRYWLPVVAGLFLILLLTGTSIGSEGACRWEPPDWIEALGTHSLAGVSGDRDMYTGTIRVFVTEMNSRWKDDDNVPFRNGFLSFALEEYVFVGETDTLEWDVEWNGYDYQDANGLHYGDLRQENVKVIAAVYNSAGYTGYSDPPNARPFTVHEVDASAAAIVGTPGYNETAPGFTHTVFVEDGSTTW